jgi:hypothetical protein
MFTVHLVQCVFDNSKVSVVETTTAGIEKAAHCKPVRIGRVGCNAPTKESGIYNIRLKAVAAFQALRTRCVTAVWQAAAVITL